MKRLFCALLCFAMTFSLVACGNNNSNAGPNNAAGSSNAETSNTSGGGQEIEPLTLVWGDYHASSTTFYKSMELFRDLVAEKSGGAITVELYPDSQLGSQLELVEAVRSGDVDITYTSSFANYSPEFS